MVTHVKNKWQRSRAGKSVFCHNKCKGGLYECACICATPFTHFFFTFSSSAGVVQVTFCQQQHHSSVQVCANYWLSGMDERHHTAWEVLVCGCFVCACSQGLNAQWRLYQTGLKPFSLCLSSLPLCSCAYLHTETGMFRHSCGHTLLTRSEIIHTISLLKDLTLDLVFLVGYLCVC